MRRWHLRVLTAVPAVLLAVSAAIADPVAENVTDPEVLVEPAAPPPITVVDGVGTKGLESLMSRAGDLILFRQRGSSFAHVEMAPAPRAPAGPAMAGNLGAEGATAEIPAEYALRPNAPNPTRGQSWIGFDLPTASRVRLEIFDLQGRRVRTVADGEFAAGRHARSWSAREREGERLAPGVYFAKIDARAVTGPGHLAKIEKLVLIE